jgi:hypothetical protein
MGIFKRGERPVLPAPVLTHLAEYGQDVLTSRSGSPAGQRFGWDYVGPVGDALRGPKRDRAIQELYDAARSAANQPMVTFGAYNLMLESRTLTLEPGVATRDKRFLELCDSSLDHLHRLGYSSGILRRDEADRWIEVHGDLRSSFDNIVDAVVPEPSEAPAAADLHPGETRLVALTAPLPEGNAFYAQRQAGDSYIVFSERQYSNDDPTRARYDESDLGVFAAMPDLLRAVGQMFGTRPYWAHEDLEPYFPRRRP